ncbi:TraB/GumN family protein [Pedobacter gandavensis]|uniref:TraB/GumN family protein n=1 Tax=Pedobacter gandavensis TaxID=2679963 RepID=UPI002931D1C9|nr:TraB/GumN family protein [Pedobacter gandavensis]
MSFKSFLLFAAMFSVTSLFAQKHSTTLWEISKKGTKHKSYVFGTNHGVKGDYLDKLTAVKEALKNSDLLMTEADYLQKKVVDTNKVKASRYINYREFLDSASFQFLDSAMLSVDNPSLEKLNSEELPFTNVFVGLFNGNVLGFDNQSDLSLDAEIYEASVALNKKFQSLDLISKSMSKEKEMLDIYKLLSRELILSLKNPEEIKKLKKEIDNFYLSNKEYAFKERVKVRKTDMAKYVDEKILLERNSLWLPHILKAVNNGPTFIAVGFAHLKYKEGILMRLEENGYQVKPKDLMIAN